MKPIRREDLLDIVGCEIEKRPDAPTMADLAPLVSRYERTATYLAVDFPASAGATVEGFAAAERTCCAGIGWDVTLSDITTLRITAGADALDALEQTLRSINIEKVQ